MKKSGLFPRGKEITLLRFPSPSVYKIVFDSQIWLFNHVWIRTENGWIELKNGGKQMKLKRMIMVFIVFVFFFALSNPVFGEEDQDIVRVGYYEFPYFQEVGDDGSYSGYSYDYLQAISQYTGWEYKYVLGSTFSECQEMLKNGEIDILGLLQKTPDRENIYEFPDIPSGISMSLLVTSVENQSLAYEDFPAFDGMTVGLQKSFARNKGFQDFCEEKNFTVRTVSYDTAAELFGAIHRGKVDAALISSEQLTPYFRIIAKFDTTNVYYATTKGNEKVLDELNDALSKMKAATPNFDNELYYKYYDFSSGQKIVLSKAEEAFIKEHSTIRVLYDAERLPFEGVGEDGIPHGIIIDVLEEIGKAVGVNFEYTFVKNREEKKEMFRSGEYDLLSAITYNYQWANEYHAYLTQPFLDVDYLAVTKTNNSNINCMALPKGFFVAENFKKRFGDTTGIIYYDTVEDCLNAVNNQAADCTFVNTYEAEYYLTIPKYRTLQFRTVQGVSQNICVGISKEEDPILFSIISKGMASISEEKLREIIRIHLNHPKQSSFLDLMYTNPVHFVILMILLGFLIAAYFVVFVQYRNKRRENEILQTANKAKADFLSHMSHDMRTPINAVIGMSSLGVCCSDLEISKDYHKKVNQTSKYLLTLINDTLDMSAIENNKLKLHPRPYCFHDFLQAIETIICARAMEKEVMLHMQIRSDFKQLLNFDRLRLQQIFINLINNAIKFTPPGGIVEFIVDAEKVSEKRLNLTFIVRDTGIGMSEAFQKKMFEPFEQEDRTLQTEGGTGLGLAIAKELIDLMGGRIGCHSQLGTGTEFTVQIETDICETEIENNGVEEVLQKGEVLAGRRVLLCEDHPINAQISKALLEKMGCIVDHAENGQAGIELFLTSSEWYYDLVLMDIRMPLVNGYEAARRIRSLMRKDAGTVPIIAMSANTSPEDVRMSLEAGMDAHISKAIDSEEFYLVLEKLIKNKKE